MRNFKTFASATAEPQESDNVVTPSLYHLRLFLTSFVTSLKTEPEKLAGISFSSHWRWALADQLSPSEFVSCVSDVSLFLQAKAKKYVTVAGTGSKLDKNAEEPMLTSEFINWKIVAVTSANTNIYTLKRYNAYMLTWCNYLLKELDNLDN